ncbi:MAG: thioredoxin family protein [Pirellulales bacterium]
MNQAIRWTIVFALILIATPKARSQNSLDRLRSAPSIPSTFSFGDTSKKLDAKPGTQADNTNALWTAAIEPAIVAANEKASIVLTASLTSNYHLYGFVPADHEPQLRTLIVVSQKSGLRFQSPTTASPLITKDLGGGLVMRYHEGEITWRIPFEVPVEAKPGLVEIELLVGFNTCDDKHCDPPAGIRFVGTVQIVEGNLASTQSAAMKGEVISFDSVAQHPHLATWIDASISAIGDLTSAGTVGLQLWMSLAALVGGFILNFMPCVLPVIGLKLLSFVNQAGSDHRRVIQLNLSFVAGIMTVVSCLALFNISMKLVGSSVGWGEQFNSFPFQVGIVILLFSMSLSFLGVWEIPIPGFATGRPAGQLMQREGIAGAYYKGLLTTVLATPCSGPLLGAVFGETLKLSALAGFVVFACVGIGLGFPYLVMCIWPGIIRWLPKPGEWMETLKQFLAFPMLLSMVWFLNIIDSQYHIAMLVSLIGVWFGCWIVGRLPAYAETQHRVRIWATVIAGCAVFGLASFKFFGPVTHYLPWQPYSEAALNDFRAQGKPVMIEFTARWCPTCQTNMRLAIDRPEIAKLVKQHDITTLLADWTDASPNSPNSKAIRKKVHELESNSIPLLAVYPADPKASPIILRDVITQSQLIQAIEQATSSSKAAMVGDRARVVR